MSNAVFARHLHDRRKALGFTQRDLASRVGVTTNTIQSYEMGALPRGQHLLDLAQILTCSIDWLVGYGLPREIQNDDDDGIHTFISPPLLSEQDRQMLYRTNATALNFDLDWLTEVSSNPSNVALLTIHGPTMAPTLLDGDLVAVDKGQCDVHQGRMYAAILEGPVMVVRLEYRPGGILRVVSDNREIAPPYEVEASQVQVLGAIIWLGRRLR